MAFCNEKCINLKFAYSAIPYSVIPYSAFYKLPYYATVYNLMPICRSPGKNVRVNLQKGVDKALGACRNFHQPAGT